MIKQTAPSSDHLVMEGDSLVMEGNSLGVKMHQGLMGGLAFRCEDDYNQSLLSKKSQHYFLLSLLLDAGWTLPTTVPPPPLPTHLQTHPPPPIPPTAKIPPAALASPPPSLANHIHIIIHTHSCTLSCSLQCLLSVFSIPSHASHTLLCAFSALFNHTVRSSHAIVTTRRHLERDTLKAFYYTFQC